MFACLLLESGFVFFFPVFATLFLLSYHLIPLLQAGIMSLMESRVSCTSQVWTMAVLPIIPNVQITHSPVIPLFCPEGEQIPTAQHSMNAFLLH